MPIRESTSKASGQKPPVGTRSRSQPPPVGPAGSPTWDKPPHALHRKKPTQKLDTSIELSTSDITKTETLRRTEPPQKNDIREDDARDPPRGSRDGPPRGSKVPTPIQDGKKDRGEGKPKTSDKQTDKEKHKKKQESHAKNPKKPTKSPSPNKKDKKLPKKTTKERTEKPPRERRYYKFHTISTPSKKLITATAHLRRTQN